MSRPHPLRRRVRDQLGDESGIVMIVAMVTMLIISVLAASAITLALNTDAGAQQNISQKAATQAAEAGLQVALYRYNSLQPPTNNCVGDTVPATAPSNGICSSSVTQSGSNSTYQYYTTSATSSTPCGVGATVTSSSATVNNICITSIGTSGGVSVRAEIHAAANVGGSLFQFPGIIGKTGITEQNGTISINGAEATDGSITASCCGSGLTVNSQPNYVLDLGGPSATYTQGSGSIAAPNATNHVSSFVLPPVNPGTSATTSANTGCGAYPAIATSTCGISSNDIWPFYDPVTYTPISRSLTMGNGASIYLNPGTYNFCSFTSTGGTITLAPSVSAQNPVIIYIDSPNDPIASGCPQGSGQFNLSGNDTTFNNPTGNPVAEQLYVAGSNPVALSLGGGTFTGTLYAPAASVDLTNNSLTINGAIAANFITMGASGSGLNLNFSYDPRVASIQGGASTGTYYRTAYGQCVSTVSSGSPFSGCN